MAKRPPIDEREFKALWKGLPESDRRFISAWIVISEAVGDKTLRYRELPPPLERVLHGVDRDTLFSVITECLGLLTGAPAMDRVKRTRRRNGKGKRTPPKKRATVRASRTRPKAKRRRSK